MTPQRDAHYLGEAGCYFFSILRIAEVVTGNNIDAMVEYNTAFAMGDIEQDCFVNRPAELLSRLTGGKWAVMKGPADAPVPAGAMEILRFERVDNSTGKQLVTGHFVLGDGKGGVAFDPYGDSKTVREGHLVSKRIFALMA